MMRNFLLLFFFLGLGIGLIGQTLGPLPGGRFGLGVRSTVNIFGDYQPGMGAGSQWKLSLGKRVNTQWFFDYINSRKGEDIYRKDYHIGWSVQFALLKNGFRGHKVVPYLAAGHCFDWTKVGIVEQEESPFVFTSAVQAGAGLSYFAHPNIELVLQSQFMMHLGRDVHAHDEGDGHYHINIERAGVEGHLLSTVAFNFYFLQLWNR